MKLALLLILLTCLVWRPSYGELTAEDFKAKMTKGIAAGQGIIKALTSEQMTSAFKNIAKIAGALGPFLGAAGPVVSLISMFLPKQESAELKYMKEQFSKMDQKFDQVFNQFGEVKNLIQQTSLKTQYGAYEHQIKSLSGKLSEYLQAPVDEAPVFRRTFISDYKSTYENAAGTLYTAMVSEGTLFNNIPKVAKAYTNNNRRKVQKIMKGILNLILQGVKVELTYLSLNNMTLDYKIRKRLWDKKIRQVIDHMQKFDEQMEKDWFSSLSKDVKKTLADKTGKSNDEFADALYSEISDKYDWREFHVIAYDEIAKDGYKKHYLKRCGGVHWFKKGGRNTVVASNDKAKPVMNRQHTQSALRGVKTRRKHWISWKRKRSAMDVFNDLKAMRPAFMNCGYYASFGVIDKGQKIVHRANKKRLVTVQSNNFQLFAYG